MDNLNSLRVNQVKSCYSFYRMYVPMPKHALNIWRHLLDCLSFPFYIFVRQV